MGNGGNRTGNGKQEIVKERGKMNKDKTNAKTNKGRLAGKNAFITGAGSGIGLAAAKRFAQEGASVFGADLQNAEGGDEGGGEWAEVQQMAPASDFFTLDVTAETQQTEIVDGIVAKHGPIDIVMTAAGVASGGFVHMLDAKEWQRVIDINLTGTMLSVKACLKSMIENKSGSIITVASVEGLEGCEGGSGYNASKGGVVLLTKNLACDYGRLGIRANAICPGFIETPMFKAAIIEGMGEERADPIRYQHKLGRWGKPEEIAGAALFLASEDASFVSGVALPVDGGYTAGHYYGLAELAGLA